MHEKKGTIVIYTCHGFQFFKGSPKKDWLLYYTVEKKLSKITDLLITINSEDFRLAKEKFKCPTLKIDGVGVDLNKYSKKHSSKELQKARAHYGFQEKDFVIVYIAEFSAIKNHSRLLEAAAPIILNNPRVKLLFLGQGTTMENIQNRAAELNISKNVIMPGYVKGDFAALLQSCNLGLSASYREGLGLGLLECIASGLPIIVADNRGHRDIVSKNKKCLFNPLDPNDIRKKLSEAIKTPSNYRIDFPERFSLRSSLSEMNKIYRDLLDI